MNAERAVQPKFRNAQFAASLVLLAAIALFDGWLARVPDRRELGWRAARIEFQPVRLAAAEFAPLRLAGAWRMDSTDPRFGGVSALAVDAGQLIALTDAGALIRFRPLRNAAWIGELPGGPGSGRFKRHRDSEAMVRDLLGRGWWVAFENRHQLWLFDRDFGRALRRVDLGRRGWGVNRGIEGLAADGDALLLLHEHGDRLLRVTGTRARSFPIAGARGRISDAAAIGPGRFLAVERRVNPFGFRNALVSLERADSTYRVGRRITLSLGPLDNVEAIAVERRSGGGLRLWLMTDDNFQPPMRTLLIALDWPALRQ